MKNTLLDLNYTNYQQKLGSILKSRKQSELLEIKQRRQSFSNSRERIVSNMHNQQQYQQQQQLPPHLKTQTQKLTKQHQKNKSFSTISENHKQKIQPQGNRQPKFTSIKKNASKLAQQVSQADSSQSKNFFNINNSKFGSLQQTKLCEMLQQLTLDNFSDDQLQISQNECQNMLSNNQEDLDQEQIFRQFSDSFCSIRQSSVGVRMIDVADSKEGQTDRKLREIIRRLQLRDAIYRQEITKMQQIISEEKGSMIDILQEMSKLKKQNEVYKQKLENCEQEVLIEREKNICLEKKLILLSSAESQTKINEKFKQKIQELQQEKQTIEEVLKNFLFERELGRLKDNSVIPSTENSPLIKKQKDFDTNLNFLSSISGINSITNNLNERKFPENMIQNNNINWEYIESNNISRTELKNILESNEFQQKRSTIHKPHQQQQIQYENVQTSSEQTQQSLQQLKQQQQQLQQDPKQLGNQLKTDYISEKQNNNINNNYIQQCKNVQEQDQQNLSYCENKENYNYLANSQFKQDQLNKWTEGDYNDQQYDNILFQHSQIEQQQKMFYNSLDFKISQHSLLNKDDCKIICNEDDAFCNNKENINNQISVISSLNSSQMNLTNDNINGNNLYQNSQYIQSDQKKSNQINTNSHTPILNVGQNSHNSNQIKQKQQPQIQNIKNLNLDLSKLIANRQ